MFMKYRINNALTRIAGKWPRRARNGDRRSVIKIENRGNKTAPSLQRCRVHACAVINKWPEKCEWIRSSLIGGRQCERTFRPFVAPNDFLIV